MKIRVIQEEYSGIPQEPELFIDEAKAQARFEELIASETDFRKRTKDEISEAYYEAYWDYLREEGSEEKSTIRYWELESPETVAPPGILEASKSALEVLESITEKLCVPDKHSRSNLDENEIAEIFIEAIQGSAELSQAIVDNE